MIWFGLFVFVFIIVLIYQFCKSDGVPQAGLKYFSVSKTGDYINIYPLDKMPGEFLEFQIAGCKYRKDIDNYLGEFVADLVPEPRNKFDRNAIKIVACRDGHHVGYVPQNMTTAIRAARTLPCVCFCYIAKRNGQYITSCFVNTPGL